MTILTALTTHGYIVTIHHFNEFSDGLLSNTKTTRINICQILSELKILPNRHICSFRANMCEHQDQLEDYDLVLYLNYFPMLPDYIKMLSIVNRINMFHTEHVLQHRNNVCYALLSITSNVD
jgi:hypothetical protein